MAAIIWIALFIAVIFVLQYLKWKKYPPGPFPYPLVGSIPELFISAARGKPTALHMLELKKKFGPVYTIWIGPYPAILICDYDLIVEHFVKNGENFSGRWRPYLWDRSRGGNYGMLHADGPAWQEQRRFSLHVLRDFGFGRNLMEVKIMEEVHNHIRQISESVNQNAGRAQLDLNETFELLVGSVINKVLVGYGFDESNKNDFLNLRHHFDNYATHFNVFDMVIYSDWTVKLPLIGDRYRRRLDPLNQIRNMIAGTVEKHRRDFNAEEEPNDFIDAYFREMKKRDKEGVTGSFSKPQLISLCQDLWMAGMETTVTTLNWAIVYLLRQPDIQENIKDEIRKVVGNDREVSLEDRKQLPYLSAFCVEIHRLASILNFNLWHRTLGDTIINGWNVAANTLCTPQISVVFLDETVFKNPMACIPERYLDPINGRALEQKVIAFGVGKRSCLGESLAKAEFFLVLANFIKHFTFSTIADESIPTTEPLQNLGLLHRPKPHHTLVQFS